MLVERPIKALFGVLFVFLPTLETQSEKYNVRVHNQSPNREHKTIALSHKSTQQARDNSSCIASKNRDRQAVAQLFYFGGREVNGGNIKDGFASTHDDGRTARNVAVHAVGIVDIFEHSDAPVARQRANDQQFAQLFGYAHQSQQRCKKFAKIHIESAQRKEFDRNQNCTHERENRQHESYTFFCAVYETIKNVGFFTKADHDNQNDENRYDIFTHWELGEERGTCLVWQKFWQARLQSKWTEWSPRVMARLYPTPM